MNSTRTFFRMPQFMTDFDSFLRAELGAFPGRGNLVTRSVACSAMVIVTSMALQVPLLPLSLLVVFFVTQSNVVLTRLVGIMLIVGVTLAVAISILMLRLTFNYPLLRILMANSVFVVSVYLMRTSKMSMPFFLVAIVVLDVQSIVDLTDNAEELVRECLWVWVAVSYPTALSLLVNSLLLPREPAVQLCAEMRCQLAAVKERLQALIERRESAVTIDPADLQRGAMALQKLLRFANMRNKTQHRAADSMRDLAYVTTVSRLYRAAYELAGRPAGEGGQARDTLQALHADCTALELAIANGQMFRMVSAVSRESGKIAMAPTLEMERALRALDSRADGAASAMSAPRPATPRMPDKSSLLLPDAFSNPAYVRFSLRTLLSVVVCYVFYNAVRWPGIHTIMLTGLVVALPSAGGSNRHGILRVTGSALGSGLALFMVVFVIPHLESIVGLLAISLPVIALGAWVSAGSERTSYAGVQIMFTFALALLDQLYPPSDLTEIRDRMVGIVLGVAVAALVQTLLWPEGEASALRAKLAATIRSIADTLQRAQQAADPHGADVSEAQAPQHTQTEIWAAFVDIEAMLARVALETGWQEGEHARIIVLAQTALEQTRATVLAANRFHIEAVMHAGLLEDARRTAVLAFQLRAAQALRHYAEQLQVESPCAVRPAAMLDDTVGWAEEGSSTGERSLYDAARALDRCISGLPDWNGSGAMQGSPVNVV
jgi:multidrug resistance protein MdtO